METAGFYAAESNRHYAALFNHLFLTRNSPVAVARIAHSCMDSRQERCAWAIAAHRWFQGEQSSPSADTPRRSAGPPPLLGRALLFAHCLPCRSRGAMQTPARRAASGPVCDGKCRRRGRPELQKVGSLGAKCCHGKAANSAGPSQGARGGNRGIGITHSCAQTIGPSLDHQLWLDAEESPASRAQESVGQFGPLPPNPLAIDSVNNRG